MATCCEHCARPWRAAAPRNNANHHSPQPQTRSYHHTESDTVDKLDPAQLQVVAAANAVWAASIANLPFLLPRT